MRRSSIVVATFVAVLGVTPALAYPRPGATELVSLAHDGALGNMAWETASEWPALTPDARLVAFHSSASNLVPGDGNERADIFLRDRDAATTTRLSVATNGTEGTHDSWAPRITPDGRFVAFESWASSLWAGDEGWADVFVHDRQTGFTERISNPVGGGNGNESSFGPAISDDGRWVAFESDASNLIAGDVNNASDVFLFDRDTDTLSLISRGPGGVQGDAFSGYPSISADGRYVAFNSRASNLVIGDRNATYDDFVYDRVTNTLELVSVASDGTQGNAGSFGPKMSADGRHVAFTAEAANLVADDGNGSTWDVFVRDRETDRTRRVSVSSAGAGGNAFSALTGFSPDGRYVMFWSDATNLVPGDTNGERDVFLHDVTTGTTELISVTHDGTGGNDMSWGIGTITPGGRHVGFMSVASNIVSGDTNGGADVFVRDRGPELGIRTMSAVPEPGGLRVDGEVTFSGAAVAVAADPSGDAGAGGPLGADLTSTAITYRPESGDLLARLRVASMPSVAQCAGLAGCAGVGGAPGVLYGLELKVGSTRYEVRAMRVAATAESPGSSEVALFRCTDTCTQVSALSGAVGATDSEVTAAIPLSALNIAQGATVDDVRAFSAAGEMTLGAIQEFDGSALGDVMVPGPEVRLGAAPEGTPGEQVDFGPPVQVASGAFSGSVPGAAERVWARICLGDDCRLASLAT